MDILTILFQTNPQKIAMILIQTTSRCLGRHIGHLLTRKQTTYSSCRPNSMLAWTINDSLSNQNEVEIASKLKCIETRIPTISSPWDVLVKVHATSINPLDVRMVYGYGRRVLDLLSIVTNFEPRITNDRYPLTLGRDFSGEVVATGPCVNGYKVGDLVFGAVEPQRSGAHAQFVTVPSYCLTRKPENLTHEQAASVPFVALTAYSALSTIGQLSRDNCNRKQVLVIGGSGGVGSFAIQLLKLWNASVVATCSEEKIEWLEDRLFVDQAICHHDQTMMDTLYGKFDFVLDCGDYEKTSQTRENVVERSLKYLKPYSQSIYVTLSPPLLSNTDKHGIVLGTANSLFDATCDTLRGLTNLNSARWAVFLPNKSALKYVSSLYEDEAIEPQISSVYNFNQMPGAFSELQDGRTRGKVVVRVDSNHGDYSSDGGKDAKSSAGGQ